MSVVTLSDTFRPERHELGAVHMFQSPRNAFGDLCDPVIQVDHFFMSYPYFAPHPHAGFSAVTYMLENSPGGFVNRDSRGDRSHINPGDLHWTWAGSGILHEEIPQKPGLLCHGLQIFVNMSNALRTEPPRIFHLERALQPQRENDGVRLKVVVGNEAGLASPVTIPDPFKLLDLRFAKASNYQFAVPTGWGGLCLAIEGSFIAKTGNVSRRIDANETLAFSSAGTQGELDIVAETVGTLVLLSGRQLKEPLVAGGPFVEGSEDALNSAVRRFQKGEMGELKKSF